MIKTVFILNGPPCAGKGIWGKILKTLLSAPIVGVGDLLRDAQNSGLLSKSISDAMNAGYLLNDDDIWAFLQPALNGANGKSFILDGFPRTENQVNMMITWCADNEYAIRYLLLEQSRAKTEFRTNIRKNIGTNLILRKDDAPDSVVVRYNEFEKHTRSVGEILTANPPSDFAMVTLDIDQIELVSKFLVGVFSTTQDDTNKNA